MDYSPSKRTTPQLLGDWAAIMRELAARDVIRTNNNPLGDIAELVVASHFEGKRGSFSQAGWDVITPAGEKVQVKSLREVSGKKRTNFSPISDADYDFVVLVIFDENFRVTPGHCGSTVISSRNYSPLTRKANGSSGGARSSPETRRSGRSTYRMRRSGFTR